MARFFIAKKTGKIYQPFSHEAVYNYNAFFTCKADQTFTFKSKIYENW
ncbi:hypothetical protein C943_03768 [Mariniradius saccharolyticus AK6]|uniref:Uncharacterized protein n=1 Tax=Mariniradius saccharolyticus AK6 TaxID=1239962 RepID=M7XJ15_9BACT|nr:hypothetical protein C943_03768 [Mariniradius saccharolyticus AK6]